MILNTMVALMMLTANQTHFSTTTLGEFYEVSNIQYDTQTDTSYTLFTRYYVYNEYAPITQAYHFQVRPYKGKVTKADMLKDGQARSDAGITVIAQ